MGWLETVPDSVCRCTYIIEMENDKTFGTVVRLHTFRPCPDCFELIEKNYGRDVAEDCTVSGELSDQVQWNSCIMFQRHVSEFNDIFQRIAHAEFHRPFCEN